MLATSGQFPHAPLTETCYTDTTTTQAQCYMSDFSGMGRLWYDGGYVYPTTAEATYSAPNVAFP